VHGRVAEALPGLEASLRTALLGRIDAAQQAAIAAAQQAAQFKVDSSAAALRADLDTRLGALNVAVSQQVESQVASRVSASLATLGSRIDGAGTRLDALGSQLGQLADTQKAQVTELAAIPQDLAALRADLKKGLQAEIDLQVSLVSRGFDERLASFARDNDVKLNAVRAEVSAQAVDAARKVAVEAAQSSSASLRTQLLAEMRGIARDELAVGVNTSVRTAVDSAVATQFATVPNLVTEEVKRQKLVVRNDVVLTPVGRPPG
jgi:hypothetical protein